MPGTINRGRLFFTSLVALVAVSMPFAIRTDILSALGREFDLSHREQGLIFAVVCWAYPVSVLIVGPLCDVLGMRRLMLIACVGHIVGILGTIFSPSFGFPVLLAATLMIGLADGAVEAVLNPLVATLYPDDKTGRISILHAAWPVGLIAAGLGCVGVTAAFGLSDPDVSAATVSLSWKIKMSFVLIPVLGYGALVLKLKFPQTERAAAGVPASVMFREALRPGFLIILLCFIFTAITEGGPDQWIGSAMKDTVGIRGIIFLMYSSVIMLVLRIYGGALARRMTPFGLLSASCVFAAVGLYWLSYSFTPLAAFAAVSVFAVGKTCLWPTLLGVTAERYPKGGSFLFALLSAAGMIAVGLTGPGLGAVYDKHTIEHMPAPLARVVVVDGRYSPAAVAAIEDPADLIGVRAAEKQGAAMVFRFVSFFPLLPLLVFIVFGLRARLAPMRHRGKTRARGSG